MNRFKTVQNGSGYETLGEIFKNYYNFSKMKERRFGKLIGVLDVSNCLCKFLVSCEWWTNKRFKVKCSF